MWNCAATATPCWSWWSSVRPSQVRAQGQQGHQDRGLAKELAQRGLATGKTFDRSVLDEVKQYLPINTSAAVNMRCASIPRSRSCGQQGRHHRRHQGGQARQDRQINLVGNSRFKEKDVLGTLELKTPNWLSWYKQDDRYSRESLQGDLEKLRSYYMDAAMRISRSSRRKSPSPRKKTTCTSP